MTQPRLYLDTSAARRRTFKAFAHAPRDGTPFNVAYVARYNPFAKTFEHLYRDRYNGELTWEPAPIAHHRFFCDLIPPAFELPTSFAMTFVVTPARRKTWRERITDRLFGWLRAPDTMSLMRYCWQASAMSASGQDAEERLEAKPASATAESGDAR